MSVELFVECVREAALKGDAASLCAARDVWQDLSKVDQANVMMRFSFSERGVRMRKVAALFIRSLDWSVESVATTYALEEITHDLGEAIFLANLALD